MSEPRVSVILPVRDGGAFLQPAVDSILGQTLADLELLVVDDHSIDGAIGDLRKDPRLRLLRSEGNGVAQAFRAGMQRARGKYIARMDADDIALPRRLELQLGLLERDAGIGIAGGCVRFFGSGGVAEGNRRYQGWLNSVRSPGGIRRALFIESPIPNPTAMFRREVLHRLGGYRNCGWPEDYDLFLRADAAGISMAKPEETVLEWRDHPARLTRNDPLYARERFQAAKAHFLARHRLPQGEILVWGAGPTGKRFHDLLAAEGVETVGFIEVHPRRIGGTKRGRPVHPVAKLAEHGCAFVVVAVGARGARGEIRAFMQQLGRKEGTDYLFVA